MNTNLPGIAVINKVKVNVVQTFQDRTEKSALIFIQLPPFNHIRTMITLIRGNKAKTFRKAVS